MSDPLFANFLLAVQELLGALHFVEYVGPPDRINRFSAAVENVRTQADAIALRAAPMFFLDPVPLPEPVAPSLLGNGLPEVPFIIPDVTRKAHDDAGFQSIWEMLAEHDMCDQWGGAESQRVFRLWLNEGCPEEAARFIVFHANRPHQ